MLINLESEIARAENRFRELKPEVSDADIGEIAVGYVTEINSGFAKVEYVSTIKGKAMPQIFPRTYLKDITEKGQRVGLVYYKKRDNEIRDLISLVDENSQKLKIDYSGMRNPATVYY